MVETEGAPGGVVHSFLLEQLALLTLAWVVWDGWVFFCKATADIPDDWEVLPQVANGHNNPRFCLLGRQWIDSVWRCKKEGPASFCV